MADDVHKPKLPGVRTLGEDAATDDADLGVTFLSHDKRDESMHQPEEVPSTPQGKSILSNEKDMFDVGHAFKAEGLDTGTIVTDRKKRETSITGIFSQAFDEWWGKTSTSLKGVTERFEKLKPEEPPTVEAPEKRKEIILEAAKLTKQVPRDDHHVVVEQMKTLTQDAERITGKPYFIKPPSRPEGGAPSWTHTKDETSTSSPQKSIPTLDLRGTTVAPNIEKQVVSSHGGYAPLRDAPGVDSFSPSKPKENPIKSEGPRIAPEVRRHEDLRLQLKQIPPTAPVVKPVPRHEPVPAPPPEVPTSTHGLDLRKKRLEEAALPHPVVRPLAPSMLDGHERETRIEAVPSPVRLKQKTPLRFSFPKFTLPHIQVLSRSVFIGIIVAGIVLGVGAGFFTVTRFLGDDAKEATPHAITFSGFTNNAEPFELTTPTSRDAFLSALTGKITTAPAGMVQFYPVRTVSKVSVPLIANDIVPLIAPHAGSSFVRQLSPTTMLGSVSVGGKDVPFIILKADSFDVGFAGMLAWEPWMSEDLSPLMGPRVTATRVPTSAAAEAGAPRFTDALKDNRSIRILYDEMGEERLIYAFVNRTLIVITTSSEALSAIIGNLN